MSAQPLQQSQTPQQTYPRPVAVMQAPFQEQPQTPQQPTSEEGGVRELQSYDLGSAIDLLHPELEKRRPGRRLIDADGKRNFEHKTVSKREIEIMTHNKSTSFKLDVLAGVASGLPVTISANANLGLNFSSYSKYEADKEFTRFYKFNQDELEDIEESEFATRLYSTLKVPEGYNMTGKSKEDAINECLSEPCHRQPMMKEIDAFIKDSGHTHYIFGIYLGANITKRKAGNTKSMEMGGGAKINIPEGEAGSNISGSRREETESVFEEYDGKRSGDDVTGEVVLRNSYLPLYTLLESRHHHTRLAVQQAIENHLTEERCGPFWIKCRLIGNDRKLYYVNFDEESGKLTKIENSAPPKEVKNRSFWVERKTAGIYTIEYDRPELDAKKFVICKNDLLHIENAYTAPTAYRVTASGEHGEFSTQQWIDSPCFVEECGANKKLGYKLKFYFRELGPKFFNKIKKRSLEHRKLCCLVDNDQESFMFQLIQDVLTKKPEGIVLAATFDSITASWKCIPNKPEHGTITHYVLKLENERGEIMEGKSTETKFTFYGLPNPGSNYKVKIAGANGNIHGPFGEGTIKLQERPHEPAQQEGNTTNDMSQIEQDPISTDGHRLPLRPPRTGHRLPLRPPRTGHRLPLRPPSTEIKHIQDESRKLEIKFGTIATTTYERINASSMTVDTFKSRLHNLPMEYRIEFREFFETEINKLGSKTELWNNLMKYWNFLNCTLLQSLIQILGYEDLQTEIDEYMILLGDFQTNTLACHFTRYYTPLKKLNVEDNFKELAVKYKLNWSTCTLADVAVLQDNIMMKFNLPTFAADLTKALEGSLIVLWLLPKEIALYMKEHLKSSNEMVFFNENKILSFKIDGENFIYRNESSDEELEFEPVPVEVASISDMPKLLGLSPPSTVKVPGQENLFFLLNKSRNECLNYDDDHNLCHALNTASDDEFLESSADDQLIISVSFKEPVKLHSLQITSPLDGRAPKSIKIFINQPIILDFDKANQSRAAEELCLTENDVTDEATIPLSFSKYSSVYNIVLFIMDNQGDKDTTVINHLAFFGMPQKEILDMRQFRRVSGEEGEMHKHAWDPCIDRYR